MHFVAIVTVLVLAQFLWLGFLVGRARAQYSIAAPAITGHEMFERRFRIHMNTLEQIVVFVPLMWIFAHYVHPQWAAALGVVFLVGRAVYARSYMRDPKSRSLGFGLSAVPMLICMVGIVWAAVRSLLAAA
jgi:uncharacterized MAPEG superfamily protein